MLFSLIPYIIKKLFTSQQNFPLHIILYLHIVLLIFDSTIEIEWIIYKIERKTIVFSFPGFY